MSKSRTVEHRKGLYLASTSRVMHTFDDAGANVAQGCCEWRNNRLVGRPKAGLKGLLTSSNLYGRRSHYR